MQPCILKGTCCETIKIEWIAQIHFLQHWHNLSDSRQSTSTVQFTCFLAEYTPNTKDLTHDRGSRQRGTSEDKQYQMHLVDKTQMTNQIALVCARNQRNGGMYTVDCAASAIALTSDINFDMIRAHGKTTWGAHSYRIIDDPRDLATYRKIVYWGDWQNNPIYGRSFIHAEKKYGTETNPTNALEKWRKLYQLSDYTVPSNQSVISIGNSFIGIEGDNLTNEEKVMLKDFVAKCDIVMPRDSLSTLALTEVCGPTPSLVGDGMDLSFLNDYSHFVKNPQKHDRYFCWCFDRTIRKNGSIIIKRIAKATGMKPRYVNWNGAGLPKRLTHRLFENNIDRIANASFCVTDIYHMSIATINSGTPLICLGIEANNDNIVMGDRKKWGLFRDINMERFYFDAHSDIDRAIAYAMNLSAKRDLYDLFHERLQNVRVRQNEFKHKVIELIS